MLIVVSKTSGKEDMSSLWPCVSTTTFQGLQKYEMPLRNSIPQKILTALDYALCTIDRENVRMLWCRRYFNPYFCLLHRNELLLILAISIHRRDNLNQTDSIPKNSLLAASLKSSNVLYGQEKN